MLAQRSPVAGQGAGRAALAARGPVRPPPPSIEPPGADAPGAARDKVARDRVSALAPSRSGVIRSRTGRASWRPGRDRASSGPVFPAAGGCSLGLRRLVLHVTLARFRRLNGVGGLKGICGADDRVVDTGGRGRTDPIPPLACERAEIGPQVVDFKMLCGGTLGGRHPLRGQFAYGVQEAEDRCGAVVDTGDGQGADGLVFPAAGDKGTDSQGRLRHAYRSDFRERQL